MKKPRKLRTFRALAVLIGFLLALPVGELALRIFLTFHYQATVSSLLGAVPLDPAREAPPSQLMMRDPNPKIGYHLRPGLRCRIIDMPVTINPMGFRDDTVTTGKPPRTLRVLGLGDSSMFGLGVPQLECYMKLLEAEFRNLLREKLDVQFVNAATPGYNSAQEIELFERTGLKLDPDAVLIQFDRNDLQIPMGRAVPDFIFARHCFLAHLPSVLSGSYSDIRAIFMLNQEDRLYDPTDPDSGWPGVKTAYRRLATICRQKGIPVFGLLIFEDRPSIDAAGLEDAGSLEPTHAQILDLWRELGITPIQSLPQARAFLIEHPGTWDQLTIHPGDPHPNSIGQALIAQAALPVLRETLLKKAGVTPQGLSQYPALGNIILRRISGAGLHQDEDWDGYRANWTGKTAHFRFIPAGSRMEVPLIIGHPDVSPANPVQIYFRIDGVPTAGHPQSIRETTLEVTRAGYTSQVLDLRDLDGCPLGLTVSVNRTFHTQTDPRQLGLGLYTLKFLP